MANRDLPDLQSGRIVHVDELVKERPVQSLNGTSVRVLGR
jgi:hypothetical protein